MTMVCSFYFLLLTNDLMQSIACKRPQTRDRYGSFVILTNEDNVLSSGTLQLMNNTNTEGGTND